MTMRTMTAVGSILLLGAILSFASKPLRLIGGMWLPSAAVVIASALIIAVSAVVAFVAPTLRRLAIPSGVLPVVAVAAPAIAWQLQQHQFTTSGFFLAHFGVPLILTYAVSLLLMRRAPLSQHATIVSLVLAGEVAAQLCVNPLLLLGVAQRLGVASVGSHLAGVHAVWQPQFVAVSAGAAAGGTVGVYLVARPRAWWSRVAVIALISVIAMIVGYVVAGMGLWCDECLFHLKSYVLVLVVLVAVLGAVLGQARFGQHGTS